MSPPLEAALRFGVALAVGVMAGLGWMALQHAIEGIHPMDVWWSAGVYVSVGVIVGVISGVAWAAAALGRQPPGTARPAAWPAAIRACPRCGEPLAGPCHSCPMCGSHH